MALYFFLFLDVGEQLLRQLMIIDLQFNTLSTTRSLTHWLACFCSFLSHQQTKAVKLAWQALRACKRSGLELEIETFPALDSAPLHSSQYVVAEEGQKVGQIFVKGKFCFSTMAPNPARQDRKVQHVASKSESRACGDETDGGPHQLYHCIRILSNLLVIT